MRLVRRKGHWLHNGYPLLCYIIAKYTSKLSEIMGKARTPSYLYQNLVSAKGSRLISRRTSLKRDCVWIKQATSDCQEKRHAPWLYHPRVGPKESIKIRASYIQANNAKDLYNRQVKKLKRWRLYRGEKRGRRNVECCQPPMVNHCSQGVNFLY